MLKLVNVNKEYHVGDTVTQALTDINLEFRTNEFVSVLGQSGCGKTTLLNLIGGLDQYTTGDLFINGQSTKDFKDSDWDAYRNSTIGFVFQSYNLIAHLSVLDNVEIALTLSGVPAAERIARAKKVLIDVGLKDQLYKRPNQLSGGQAQRVAIARALVNDPKIILADEPTGAIDSKTSIQIMELIKKISKDRLVIMVTHNEELANAYSDRIIRLLDGQIVEDSEPYSNSTVTVKTEDKQKKTSMSYKTALKSSFKNLISKKARTIITAIAGSIGIIGIALVLAISNGMTSYVNDMQSDTLAGFPLSINQTVSATSAMLSEPRTRMSEVTGSLIDINDFPTDQTVVSYDSDADTTDHTNILTDDYLAYVAATDPSLYNSISYSRAVALNLIAQTENGGYRLVETSVSSGGMAQFFAPSYFNEIPNSRDFIESQYDLLGSNSKYPETAQEIVLVVDKQNRVDVGLLAEFGITVQDEYTFDDLIGLSFTIIPNNDYYVANGLVYSPGTDYEAMSQSSDAVTITIVGILRVKETSSSELLQTGIGYTTMLTDLILENASESDIVVAQEASPTINVLTGTPFNSYVTYESVMKTLGGDSTPTGIQIYPVSFDTKEEIKTYLDAYNAPLEEVDKVLYTDLAETISGTISSLINTITVILAAFAAISLLVSSIMIGIITYVSVVERTKEIGIMRAIGARKKDISRIFNAETIIIGFTAGVFGILMTLFINIPLNLVIQKLIGVGSFSKLPIYSAVGLIVISVGLTFVAGLIPSKIAAKKDPVVALRTE
ncbi:MAG: ABC transporter [Tenericutes bacterium HGW-Tenericutes-1]|jgi:putative ABC transport system permease protein|nr:MAG: ABC transporter [Tenericutes bacterium HGW-Tenericutes-1]